MLPPEKSSSFSRLRRLGALRTAEGRHLRTFALRQLRVVQKPRPTTAMPFIGEKEGFRVRNRNPSLRGPGTT